MSDNELNGRLQHLLHLLELTAMFSSNADYSAFSWHRARNYNARVFSDLDHGNISWPDITNKMDPTSMMQAIEAIPKAFKEKKIEERKKTDDGHLFLPRPSSEGRDHGQEVGILLHLHHHHRQTEAMLVPGFTVQVYRGWCTVPM